jgi:2-polyprenyl-3-methyl-5-hydroxy-6-metoxy-1,4-benzoquinol methylase
MVVNLRESILSKPRIYSFFQWVISRKDLDEKIISDFLEPFEGMRILDIGSGVSTILTKLTKCTYVGIDHNEKYILRSRIKHGDKGTFFCADVSEVGKLVNFKFDRIVILRVLHHLSDGQVTHLLEECAELLNENGLILTVDVAFTPNQHSIAKYLAAHDRGQFVRQPEQYGQLICDQLKIMKIEIVEGMLRVPYTHIIFQITKQTDATN